MLKRNRGFTLIEVLVVLAIVALLASIVFPVYHSLLSRRDKTTCAFNLRAIGQGLRLYVDDFGAYPPDRTEQGLGLLTLIGPPDRRANPQGGGQYLEQVSHEYIRKLDILHCPRNWVTEIPAQFDANRDLKLDWNSIAWSSMDPALGGWGNYDAMPKFSSGTSNPSLEPRYLRSRGFDQSDVDYRRQLISAHPPADTVVTWCTFHYSDDVGERPGRYDLALVLFADGSVENIYAITQARGDQIIRARHSEAPGG